MKASDFVKKKGGDDKDKGKKGAGSKLIDWIASRRETKKVGAK